jgi:CRISPR-associated protein Csx17
LNLQTLTEPEFRLALAFSTTQRGPILSRSHLEPVLLAKRLNSFEYYWADQKQNDTVWGEGSIPRFLNSAFNRRLLVAKNRSDGWPDQALIGARLVDINAFIEGFTDDDLLSRWMWALSLIDWFSDTALNPLSFAPPDIEENHSPSAFYSLLRLCYQAEVEKDGLTIKVPVDPQIHRLASVGDSLRASELASRRLRVSRLAPAVDRVELSPDKTVRAAASLMFPLNPIELKRLSQLLLRPDLNK